jgi:hypothetical protein
MGEHMRGHFNELKEYSQELRNEQAKILRKQKDGKRTKGRTRGKGMTREKAIEMLEYIRHTGNGESEYKNCAQSIAIDMAIKA